MKPILIRSTALGAARPARRLPGRASRRSASTPTRSLRRRRPADRADRGLRRNRRAPVQVRSRLSGARAHHQPRRQCWRRRQEGAASGHARPCSPTSLRCGRRRPTLASATARLENADATEVRQRTLLQQNVATQAQFDAAKAGPRDRGGQRHQRQGESRQGRGAARLYRASRRLRRRGHRRRGGTRAGGPAGADRHHGGSPGHPRGGGRPAREHRAGPQAGSPLRHRPAG